MTVSIPETSQNKVLCIYHGNCADGFGAAWAVWRYYTKGNPYNIAQGVEFHAGTHGDPPPEVKDREVIIVDFSYKRLVMEKLLEDCKSLILLDHHKTAVDDLAGLFPEGAFGRKYCVVFDMHRSGAMITWDHFFPGEEPPRLLKHIQDRDLWKFELEGTEDVQASLFSYEYDFKVWDALMLQIDLSHMCHDGLAITRKHHKDIDELIKVTGREMLIGGVLVPVANLPYTMSSDAGHKMGVGKPFAACYYDTPEGRCFSLRSPPDGIDVGEIAKKYGGGGHKHAAGFRMPLGWEGDL